MTKITSFYDKVEKYHASQKKNIKSKFNPDKNYKYKFSKDKHNNHIIEVFDDTTLKLKAKYEVIGMYNLSNSIWYWAWNISFINKGLTNESKKVRDFAKDIKENYKKYPSDEADQLHYVSTNGNFYISYDNVIRLIKLALYLSKGKWYLFLAHDKKNTTVQSQNAKNSNLQKMEYILIKEIIQFG
jgi:hypothetical protein